MTAQEIYRKWISDYKQENNTIPNEPIEDGDILDWLAQKQALDLHNVSEPEGEFPIMVQEILYALDTNPHGNEVKKGVAVAILKHYPNAPIKSLANYDAEPTESGSRDWG